MAVLKRATIPPAEMPHDILKDLDALLAHDANEAWVRFRDHFDRGQW
jgi:hypothetical protein